MQAARPYLACCGLWGIAGFERSRHDGEQLRTDRLYERVAGSL